MLAKSFYLFLLSISLSSVSPLFAQSTDGSALSTTTTTPVYVWTDTKGVRHYTDQPPLNKDKMVPRQMTVVDRNLTATQASGLSPADQQQQEIRAASCATAHRNLDLINDPKSTILMEGNTGKTGELMNDKSREQARALAQQQIHQFCPP